MTDLSGQYLGRYHLVEQLGEGGMAVVYRAYDTRLERDVAVKIIRSDAFPPERLAEILKRFEREAKSLARLSHPNIVKVHDYGDHNGSPYLILEYLPGGTLKKMLGKPMPWEEAIRLILPVARGLAYAHQHGILHRDIKPSNILITESGEPMLSDFGIAKILEGKQSIVLTESGVFVGTPEYTAPEQWTGTSSPPSDMYSLGIVLYELMTGRKPYVADTPAAILLKQASEPLPRPSDFVGDLPESVERLLIKALAKNPADRYTDMDVMVGAMEMLVGISPLPAPPPSVVTEKPSTLERTVTPTPTPLSTNLSPRAAQGAPNRWANYRRRCLPIAAVMLCGIGAVFLGILLVFWNNIPSLVIDLSGMPAFDEAVPPEPTVTAAPPVVALFDGSAEQTFSDKPDIIVYANVQAFPPPPGITLFDNCTETNCWRSAQFLALRGSGTFLEVSVPSATEMGVQFWGDTNDGPCRVLVDGQEFWSGNTHGTDGNWPGGAYVKYLYISGLPAGSHTIRVEFVGPGDVTIRYFGFGTVAP